MTDGQTGELAFLNTKYIIFGVQLKSSTRMNWISNANSFEISRKPQISGRSMSMINDCGCY